MSFEFHKGKNNVFHVVQLRICLHNVEVERHVQQLLLCYWFLLICWPDYKHIPPYSIVMTKYFLHVLDLIYFL